MPQIGYVSSFVEADGIGFLRSADRPAELVLFRRTVVDEQLVDHLSLVGLEVEYEVPAPARRRSGAATDADADEEGEHQVEATAVRPHVVPTSRKVTPLPTGDIC